MNHAFSALDPGVSPRERATRVVSITARAWAIAPVSPRALARRAPHGHVPVRALRRLRKAAAFTMTTSAWQGPPAIAHSW